MTTTRHGRIQTKTTAATATSAKIATTPYSRFIALNTTRISHAIASDDGTTTTAATTVSPNRRHDSNCEHDDGILSKSKCKTLISRHFACILIVILVSFTFADMVHGKYICTPTIVFPEKFIHLHLMFDTHKSPSSHGRERTNDRSIWVRTRARTRAYARLFLDTQSNCSKIMRVLMKQNCPLFPFYQSPAFSLSLTLSRCLTLSTIIVNVIFSRLCWRFFLMNGNSCPFSTHF